MASRQSVSSILKPQKIRAPLKEIESFDQDADEDTATLPKKKVSFSGMNNIKMFSIGASSLTVPTLFDEQISMMSDSSNGEKTKLSGKLEKSDGQMTFESTNCTNMEENGRVIIEYESPNENMEITEAFSGKIFSDTIYTMDNNGSEHTDYSLDYSANNMEFTEVMGQILTTDISNKNSIEMSEILNNKKQPDAHLEHTNSIPFHDICAKNVPHNISQSSNIDIPHAHIELHSNNLPKMTESSNMELSMFSAPQKSFSSSNDHKSCSSLELPQSSDRQVFEDNCELVYEYCQEPSGIELGTISENKINENNNCELEIVQDLCPKTSEIKNCLNHQNVSSGFENTNYNEDVVEKLSSSVISMDIDPTYNDNENDSYVNMDTSKLAVHDKTNPIIPITLEIEDKECAVKDVQDNYSNIIEIINHSNIDVNTPMVPTSSSFVKETSPEINLDKSMLVEKPMLQSTLLMHTSMFNESHSLEIDTSLEVKENHQKKYSRKTMIHATHKESSESEGMSDTSAINQENDKYSRNSFTCISEFSQTPAIENEDNSNNFAIVKENLQKKCSRKSIVLTSDFDKTLFKESEDYSDISAAVEDSQQKVYSRKSVRLKSVTDEISFKENTDYSDLCASVEENQNICSTKSISPIKSLDFDQIQSKEYKNISDSSVLENDDNQRRYSRKSMGPTAILNANNFSDDSSSNYSLIIKGSNYLSLASNNSKINNLDLSNHEKKMVLNSGHDSVLPNMIGDDDLNSPFRKKSRKTVSPIQSKNQPIYDSYDKGTDTSNNKKNKPDNKNDDTIIESIEYSKMDESVEIEHGDYCIKNISAEDLDIPITKQTSNTLICENVNSSSSINDSLKQSLKEKSLSFSKEPNVSATSCNIRESKEHKKNVQGGIYEIDDQKLVVSDEMEQHKIHLNKLTEDYTNSTKNLIESNDKRNIESFKHSMDTNNICIDLGIDDISNMSISDEIDQKIGKSFLESRKRSYDNRDGMPLSSSSFMYKSNVNDCTTENFNQEIFLKESPIKKISINSSKTESSIGNTIDEQLVTKSLHSEVTEFLAKWSNLYFIENQLVLDTCNNNEWVFYILDSYIKLTIKYSPIISDNSYLKVEDILLTSQKTTENEIVKFGMYWISSKYSPKVYKQICFTSRDVEILLKSLLDDIQFISLVMKNMILVRDVYCVTFKDNKAHFFLQSMNPLLMACIDVSLANIHKLSVKDITVDCLFGSFDVKVLDEIVENVAKDCNVLQSLVEKLKNFIRSI